jgi:hypothetical protein
MVESRLGKVEQDLSEKLAALAQNYTELIQAENQLRAAEVGSREEQLADITRERLSRERN